MKILGLLIVTWLVDFVWLVYWGPFWNSKAMENWEKGIHTWTLFWSSVGFVYKVQFEFFIAAS